MLSLPLSIVGALGLLLVTGRTLNIFSMIGMIMLMGLVTKNAILLVDYTNLLRSRGMGKNEALMTAGPVRLRPILMTAFSTIAGMMPVAIGLGSGAETRAPMGTAIVGGMLTSTVLTLVVIPVMYSVMDDIAGWMKRFLLPAAAAPEWLPAAVLPTVPATGPSTRPNTMRRVTGATDTTHPRKSKRMSVALLPTRFNWTRNPPWTRMTLMPVASTDTDLPGRDGSPILAPGTRPPVALRTRPALSQYVFKSRPSFF